MAQQGDDFVSLPGPPPPNPAARRSAIDAALRKFDGIEEAPALRRRPSLAGWASAHRGLAGGLITATLIAIISIPAIQVAIRDHPQETASENGLPQQAPARDNVPALAPADEASAPQASQPAAAAADEAPTAAGPALAKPAPAQQPNEPARNEQTSGFAAPPSPVMAAPAPPPPPPPPPPAPQAEAKDAADNIVVTGSRIRRSNLESAVPVTVVNAQEIADPFASLLGRLRQAINDNDRLTVAKLVALPFHVTINGERRTYNSSRAIYNDYDIIFTPAVRTSDLSPQAMQARDGGRLRGNGRIWFGCGKPVCMDEDRIRIREITP